MIYSSATLPVNAPGQVPLTRAQLWAGLMHKAREPQRFFPPGECTDSAIIEESPSHLVRQATILGDDITEIVSFTDSKLSFFQVKSPREGVIVNELIEGDHGELQLRFYAYIGLPGKAPDAPEVAAAQAWMDSKNGFAAAIASTLKHTRELVAEGRI